MEHDSNTSFSWYEATAERGPPLPKLTSTTGVDVCVVGGGLAGLTTALELARAGKRVALLEAQRVAWGASGRNGGFVSSGFALGIGDVVQKVGLKNAQALYVLSRRGVDYVRETIEKHDATIRMGKGLRVCVRYDDSGGLHNHGRDLNDRFGEDVDLSSTAETRQLLDSPRYFNSIALRTAFHIHPLRYALLLLRLCLEHGVQVFEHTAARSAETLASRFRISTDHGTIDADHVVHCVSSLDRKLHPATGRAILPVATYVAVTEPLQQTSIRTAEAVADTRRAGDYYRLIDGGRLLWGGRITTRISAPARLADVMRRDIISTFPDLGQPQVNFAWAGLMGYALHKMPLIGRDAEGQWFATAFGGHGLNTTAMAGQLIAAAIAHGDDRYQQFAPFAPHWAFGPLGRLGVQGSYWWMQAKDWRDERLKTTTLR